MGRVFDKRLVFVLIVLMFLTSGSLFAIKVTAYTNSLVARTISEIPVDYEDSFFDGPATEYNHQLAQASMGLAVSAFRPVFDKDIISPSEHAIQFMLDCGFTDLKTDDYDKNPSLYTVASIIGRKEMIDANGEPYTLLAVAVCGGGYSNEWLSNFTVGKGTRHEGFSSAANLVENRIFGYIGRANIKGRIKIWITGFSRSAAVSNITAADLVDCGVFRQEDIFAYLFATPRTTKDPKPGSYNNIFNIVGQYDPVPQVPLSSWGFERYGTNLHTSLWETDSEFQQKFDNADSISMQFTGQNFWTNPAVNFQLHNLIGFINEVCPTQDIYVDCLQDRVISMFQNRSMNNILRTLSDLSNDERIINDDNKEVASTLIDYLVRLVIEIFTESGEISMMWNPHTTMTSNLMHEHTQDVYIAWMLSSEDPGEIFTDKTEYTSVAFYSLKSNDTVRVTEGDDDCTVMLFKDGEFDQDYPLLRQNARYDDGTFVISLPHDRNYKVWYEGQEKNEGLVIFIVNFDTQSLAEGSMTVCWPINNIGNSFIFSSNGQRSDDCEYYDFDASEMGENSQFLPAGFIAGALGSEPFTLGWRTTMFMLVLIPFITVMVVVLLIAVLIRLISRKRITFMPFLFFALVMIGFILGDLYYWLYDSVTPRTITKAVTGFFTVLFALTGLWKRKRVGLLSSEDGTLSIVLTCCVFVCAVADCVINYSFKAGMIMYAVVHLCMIAAFHRKSRLSAYQWFAFFIACIAVLLAVSVFRTHLGDRRYLVLSYGFMLALLVVSGYKVSTPVALSCMMFTISDIIMEVYRSISSRLLVLHVLLMFAYYLAVFCLAYSCHRVKGYDELLRQKKAEKKAAEETSRQP